MVIINSDDAEKEAVLAAAKLMIASARTAPKGHGRDNITASIVIGEDKERLANKLDEVFTSQPNPERDFSIESNNVRNADAVVLIGVKTDDAMRQPTRLVDLGIAIGSAVKTASILNIDNRVFATAGRAAIDLKLIDANSAYGIPLSVKGSNIFFDRYDPIKKAWQQRLPPRK